MYNNSCDVTHAFIMHSRVQCVGVRVRSLESKKDMAGMPTYYPSFFFRFQEIAHGRSTLTTNGRRVNEKQVSMHTQYHRIGRMASLCTHTCKSLFGCPRGLTLIKMARQSGRTVLYRCFAHRSQHWRGLRQQTGCGISTQRSGWSHDN